MKLPFAELAVRLRTATEASIAVATARTVTTEVAIEITNALFELAGTRSALDWLNLHRRRRGGRLRARSHRRLAGAQGCVYRVAQVFP